LALTIKVAALDVADGLHVPLTTQSKVSPESPVVTVVSVKFVVVAPLTVPPSLSGAPFLRH
jgi:hypothetical protein